MRPLPAMYTDLAEWWPLLSAPADYAEEAAIYREVLEAHAQQPIARLLELGSGGGNNALHLKAHYQMTLVDLSAAMVDVSRALNPDCDHAVGDMRSVRLGEVFDAVFVHDAVDYMASVEDLSGAMETAFVHCRPGGVVLLVPDFVTETFQPGVGTGGHDGDGRGLRYMEWTHDPEPSGTTYRTDYVLLLQDGADVTATHDAHVCGLFPAATWLDRLAAAGFTATSLTRDVGAEWPTTLFVGVRPKA